MRTALYAGLVAGAVCLHSYAAVAAEGSSLRGLKPPRSAFEAENLVNVLTGSAPGLKRSTADSMPELAPRLAFYDAGMLETRRFTANDVAFKTALYQPLGQNIAPLAEAAASPLHELLPKYTLFSQVHRALPSGWGLGFGVRHSEYTFATSSLLALSAERHWGSFRSAYTLYSNRAEGSDLGSAHRFQVSYFYGERNTIGVAYTTGRDIEQSALALGSPFADVRDWTLSGRHWLSPNWALTYDLLSQEQGSLYRRQGLRLGVSRSF